MARLVGLPTYRDGLSFDVGFAADFGLGMGRETPMLSKK